MESDVSGLTGKARLGPEKELEAPGLFSVNYRSMVPLGMLVLHTVFGLVVG